jgi:hypothetical protein
LVTGDEAQALAFDPPGAYCSREAAQHLNRNSSTHSVNSRMSNGL